MVRHGSTDSPQDAHHKDQESTYANYTKAGLRTIKGPDIGFFAKLAGQQSVKNPAHETC